MCQRINAIIERAPRIEQIILLGMAVAISAENSFFSEADTGTSAIMIALRRYAISPQRQAVALAVKEVAVAMPSQLQRDIREEWEKGTLQELMQIACNNLLERE
ncbi:hypothetical protein M408DRAFT_194774 [Serendipita vermifera MAFF 305830]|uniref:Uncharacterized protein n=1 Tax=Serendipita vermifera MAFF 305830 TaxID=933852 RepID=A0A0C3B464_SERVB|nr:hypothetical protein M408DRAFT_194774 [Serendipita vermifera MAFF 305830]